jgi:hypothetical protein
VGAAPEPPRARDRGPRSGAARTGRRTPSSVAARLLLAIGLASPASAAELVVDSLGDLGATSGCELRQAILAANTDAARGGCLAGSGVDTIVFTEGLEGTLVLGAALPTIQSSLTIEGPGPDRLTVSGDGAYRVFRVQSGSVTIRGLTIADGLVDSFGRGGGLWLIGPANLRLEDCRVTGNAAFNGGGIAIDLGRARIERCTIDGNTTTGNSGAGIVNESILQLIDSTVSGNATIGEGRTGGGLLVGNESPTTTLVRNSTFFGNAAPIGANIAVLEGAEVELDSTVLANPIEDVNCDGRIVSDGHNLADDASCGLVEPDDLENVAALLAPLDADGSGPTPIHLPLPGSPLIDGGDPFDCIDAIDQRGTPRPLDGDGDGFVACDIGAIEVVPEPMGLAGGMASLLGLRTLARWRPGRPRARRAGSEWEGSCSAGEPGARSA